MRNKVLNIIAWIVFILSVVAYLVDDLSFEATYLVLVAIFLVIAPRTANDL